MARPPSRLAARRVDPLLVFMGIAALAFIAAKQLAPEDPSIVQDDAGELRQELEALSQRVGPPPTAAEREALARRWVEREILYREAIKLGLDRRDPVIKTQLVRAMTHLLRSDTPVTEPTDTELQAFLDAEPDRYGVPARWTVEFVTPAAVAGRDPLEVATHLAATLERGDEQALSTDLVISKRKISHHRPRRGLIFDYGTELADAVAATLPDRWSVASASSGPVVFRVLHTSPSVSPPLDQVRDRVQTDWLRAREAAHVQRVVAERARDYRIVLPDGLPPVGFGDVEKRSVHP